MLFGEYVERWKLKARLKSSKGWHLTQDLNLRLHVLPYLGELHIEAITPEDISTVISASQDKGHSANQTKQVYLLLSKLFNDAIQFFRLIKESPVLYGYHCPAPIKREMPYLKPEEAQKLIQYARFHWSIQAIVIQIYTGLRVGEVIALKWRDIDLEGQRLLIRSKWNRKTKKIDEYPKNKKQKWIPIGGDLPGFLLDVRTTLNGQPNDFVCASASGGMMSYNAYQKALKWLCRDAGIPIVSSHAFRHTCSALWKRVGANLDDRKLLFNHDAIASTKGYDHDDEFRLMKYPDLVMRLIKG